MDSLLDKVKKFFQESPQYASLIFIVIGISIVIAVMRNWDWILEGDGRILNMAWFSNIFGRTAARIVMGVFGVFFIVLGVVWFFLFN